eukprot:2205878-Pyramimonas_sp.AAC.1
MITIQLISLVKIRGYWSELGGWPCAIKKQGQLAIQDIEDGDAKGDRPKVRGARAGERRTGPGGSTPAGPSGSTSRGSRARR